MSHIYKITNKINGSIYIGQTTQNPPEKRWEEHIKSSKRENFSNSIMNKALRKYGSNNFLFEIIHELKDHSQEELDRLEIFYIERYKATEKPNYNIKTGGVNGSNVRGKYGLETAVETARMIEETDLTFVEIGEILKVPASWVSDINCGEIFPQLRESYPIKQRGNKIGFTEVQLDEIFSRLHNKESFTSIAEKFNTSRTTISSINSGRTHFREEETYPVYVPVNSRKRYSHEQLKEIVALLKNTTLSYYAINRDYGYASKTVSDIDKGKSYLVKLKEIGITDFPIRKK